MGRDPFWFVIGGHAVRCFCPYRPSRDVDFGVERAKDLDQLLRGLRSKGRVELLERHADTVHLRFDGLDVSIFVLPRARSEAVGGNAAALASQVSDSKTPALGYSNSTRHSIQASGGG
jgi:hypothetical protein